MFVLPPSECNILQFIRRDGTLSLNQLLTFGAGRNSPPAVIGRARCFLREAQTARAVSP